jgi:hypothetical protein
MKSFMLIALSVRTSTASTIEITDSNFRLEAGSKINAATGELEVPHGHGFAETSKTFERPLEVSVMMKQDNTKGGQTWAECGVLQVFPQAAARHTGYNAGTNWWHRHFGAGVDGAIGQEGLMTTGNTRQGKNMQYEWNEVKIRALEGGKVEFYLNGELRKTVTDWKYNNGFIRMGYGCRHYRFKDLVVKSLAKTLNHGMQTIPVTNHHWTTANGGQIRNGELYTTAGWGSITSAQTFTAPLKVSVMMKQDDGAHYGKHPECGVLQVFPQAHTRHSGYNAGTNWWSRHFGAGNDGLIGQRGNMYAHGKNMQFEWNKVSIDVNKDGNVYYYFNDILRHTEKHAQYTHGTIRMGLGCRNYHFKGITVEKPLPTQTFSKELQMNSDNFKIMNGAKFNGDQLNVKHGNGFVETYQNFQRPFSVSVMMKQDESVDWHHKHRPECGVIQVFPQNNNRHTGYNAGTNWWARQFGAGVDGAIAGRGSMQGRELEWNTVKVSVHEKRVEYYLNGNLLYSVDDTQYQEGTIRMGYGCRTFHFKDFVITTDQQPTSAPTESPTKNPTASPTKSPTERCAAGNCMNWSCADWCECYDESKLDVYNSYPECQDDNDDTCICFDKEEHGLYGERHRKINYNQDAVDADTAKMIDGTNVHTATKQNHYQEAVDKFSCDKTKRFVHGAPYHQWSSYTTQGGEAARTLCRDHWTAEQKPHGWWFQYYQNGHFNCAKFTQAVTQPASAWESTHGRPEEVCVPAN